MNKKKALVGIVGSIVLRAGDGPLRAERRRRDRRGAATGLTSLDFFYFLLYIVKKNRLLK